MEDAARPAGGTGHGRPEAVEKEKLSEGAGFAGIGLPPEAGWYVSAALYWVGGLAVVLVNQLSSSTMIDPVIGVLGAICLASSPLLLLGAHFAPNASWGAPLRIIFPSTILAIGGFVIGDAITAFALLMLFPILAVAYMHPPKISAPYCFGSVAAMAAMLLAHDSGSTSIARVIVLSGVTAAIVSGLIYSQARLRRAAADNHDRSITDPLTGLTNVRGLRSRLQQELQRSTRDQSEIVMFAIDLDDFKEVNDRFSYALGDAVLQAVAAALAEEMEPGDLLVRRGGDEFAVLCVAAPGRHMARFGDRLAGTSDRTRRAICPGVNPQASITRAGHMPGESAEAFLRRVDDGLHDAKIAAHPERGLLGSDTAEQLALDGERVRLDGARRVRAGSRISARGGSNDLALDWRMTGSAALVVATLVTAVAATGTADDLRSSLTGTCIAGLLLCSAVSFAAALRPVREGWLHVPIAVTLLLTMAIVMDAGDSKAAIAELFALPAPLAVVCFGWRQALPYAAVSAGAYAWALFDYGGHFATLQTCLFIGIMAILIALLERGQRLTSEFSAQAEAISAVDPLTGAANLRGFQQRVQQEVARSEALGDELSLTMIDLERFKAVNDRYSHSMGDALLMEVAGAIQSVVREDELVVRRGGDEFVVVCVPGAHSSMETFAERIGEAIVHARARLTPDLIAGATVVNVFREEGESADELMARADEELRRAKASERGERQPA
jgi:diguanylate cyclase (GGDEF)-like protein